MAWKQLTPTMGREVPNIKVSVHQSKRWSSVWIVFSDHFMRDWVKSAKRVNVAADEDTLQVKLDIAKDGAFALTEIKKGGAKLIIPSFSEATIEDQEATAAAVVAKSADSLTIQLPVAWREISPEQPAVKKPEPVAQQPKPTNGAGKVDAVRYLCAKGYDVKKLDRDWYLVNNSRRSAAWILNTINDLREVIELPALKITDLV